MSRLTIIALSCLIGLICGQTNRWTATLQVAGRRGEEDSVQTIWVDNTNSQSPKLKLSSISNYDGNIYSLVVIGSSEYGVFQNLTGAVCNSQDKLNSNEFSLLQAVLGFETGAKYAGQIYQDVNCAQMVNYLGNDHFASMCINSDGTPVNFSVRVSGLLYTARVLLYSTKFYDEVFDLPRSCNSASAGEIQFPF